MTNLEREKAKGNIMAATGTFAYIVGSLAAFTTIAYEGVENVRGALYAGMMHATSEAHIDSRSLSFVAFSLGVTIVGGACANQGIYKSGMAEIEEIDHAGTIHYQMDR
jgi:hypothetical protein